jgi:hypothetical protein
MAFPVSPYIEESVPQRASAIGETIEWLLLVWTASQAEEWHDRIVYLPAR